MADYEAKREGSRGDVACGYALQYFITKILSTYLISYRTHGYSANEESSVAPASVGPEEGSDKFGDD